MANLILHRDGAYNVYTTVADGPYNVYTTVADGPCYESALTLEQLQEAIRFEGGQAAIDALPARLERAHATGCSSIHGETLDECIACNRAGPNGAHLSVDEFVKRYLTLNDQVQP